MSPLSLRLLAALALLAASGCVDGARKGAAAPTPPTQADTVAADFDAPGLATDGAAGQALYVPVYSHVYSQSSSREVDLAVTLSLRNTDPDHPITFGAIYYHDSDGQLVRTYPGKTLGPLASYAYVVDEDDRTGGVGANMVVRWQSDRPVSPPIVEAVMLSTAGTQGISFVTRGRVIRPVQAR